MTSRVRSMWMWDIARVFLEALSQWVVFLFGWGAGEGEGRCNSFGPTEKCKEKWKEIFGMSVEIWLNIPTTSVAKDRIKLCAKCGAKQSFQAFTSFRGLVGVSF
jgi:hypothetical protein